MPLAINPASKTIERLIAGAAGGDLINPAALQKRVNEPSRKKQANDERTSLKRDPKFAEQLLQKGCTRGHAPSCYNLAVMYTQGDDGVEKDAAKAKDYQEKTEELVKRFGGFGMGGM